MLLSHDKKYIKAPFQNESELEQVIIANYEYIFGPSSFYLPKSKIITADGVGTIPDGFVIDIGQRTWYIVEAELISHGVYEHIVPQITKQVVASSQLVAKQKIEELAVDQYSNNQTTKEKFIDAQIEEINVRKIVGDILKTAPIVGIPIDEVNNDLREWATTVKNGMKIWIVRKFVEMGNPANIIYEFPEEFRPQIDTEEVLKTAETTTLKIMQYDVVVLDLIKDGLLKPSDMLLMNYNPRTGHKKKYEAIVHEDGSLSLLGQVFSSPSNAALAGIQDAGSDRKTVNGWTSWKTTDGKTLADLRDEFINKQADGEAGLTDTL